MSFSFSHQTANAAVCACAIGCYPSSPLNIAEVTCSPPHTFWIMGKTIHISICWKPDGAAWLLWEQESILLTDDITLWLPPPSLLSDENYAVDWWQQHLKSPPFSRPTGINWSAPRRGNLLSKILMCQYIYGTYGSMFLPGRKNGVNI